MKACRRYNADLRRSCPQVYKPIVEAVSQRLEVQFNVTDSIFGAQQPESTVMAVSSYLKGEHHTCERMHRMQVHLLRLGAAHCNGDGALCAVHAQRTVWGAGLSKWHLAGTADVSAACRSIIVGIAISEVRSCAWLMALLS